MCVSLPIINRIHIRLAFHISCAWKQNRSRRWDTSLHETLTTHALAKQLKMKKKHLLVESMTVRCLFTAIYSSAIMKRPQLERTSFIRRDIIGIISDSMFRHAWRTTWEECRICTLYNTCTELAVVLSLTVNRPVNYIDLIWRRGTNTFTIFR